MNNSDHSDHWHSEPAYCPCGSTVQAGLCMKSGLLTDSGDIDYVLHVIEEQHGQATS